MTPVQRLVLSLPSEFVFRIFDTDKNGFISHQELTTIVKHLFHLVPQSDRETESTPEKVSKVKVFFLFLSIICFVAYRKADGRDGFRQGQIDEINVSLTFHHHRTELSVKTSLCWHFCVMRH